MSNELYNHAIRGKRNATLYEKQIIREKIRRLESHLEQFISGLDLDPETVIRHLAKLIEVELKE